MATAVAISKTQSATPGKASARRGVRRSSDFDLLPENDTRHEIIQGGVVYVEVTPLAHQAACAKVAAKLMLWFESGGTGQALSHSA